MNSVFTTESPSKRFYDICNVSYFFFLQILTGFFFFWVYILLRIHCGKSFVLNVPFELLIVIDIGTCSTKWDQFYSHRNRDFDPQIDIVNGVGTEKDGRGWGSSHLTLSNYVFNKQLNHQMMMKGF